MDPYTQQLLERAEKRSKALGITSTSKFPLQESNNVEQGNNRTGRSPTKTPKKTSSTSTTTRTHNSTTKITKNVTEREHNGAESKENVDLAVEINITSAPNIQVQVEVEERDIDEHGNIIEPSGDGNHIPIMRDTSRTRLQRLGALYSDTENLSSPIHRTEGRFHEETESTTTSSNGGEGGGNKVKRFGKLAALADSINNWEDDLTHLSHQPQGPPKPKRLSSPKKEVKGNVSSGAIAKKYQAPAPPRAVASQKSPGGPKEQTAPKPILTTTKSTNVNSKRLNWDKKVMDALESQGFHRRESSNDKLVYDYNNEQNKETNDSRKPEPQPRAVNKPPAVVPGSEIEKTETASVSKPVGNVAKGLVSGRAAIFETQSHSNVTSYSSRSNQKDPAEMSLKERMALFEKNKGHALIPKAPLGISASAKQIMGDPKAKSKPQTPPTKILSYNKPVIAESKAQGNGIKNTVAALLSTGSTISESQISDDTKKQRQQEMDQLLNRFTKPVDVAPKSADKVDSRHSIPPPAPPMPPTNYNGHVDANCIINVHKRRSGDSKETLDSPEVISAVGDVKRIKVNPPKEGGLYPALSDLETTESEHDYTTASVGGSESDCVKAKLIQPNETQPRSHQQQPQQQQYYDDEEDSYMDSEDSSVGQLNGSLGREILNMVRRNESYEATKKGRKSYEKQQQYSANSSATGSEVSDVLGDIDEYLDDDDDDEIQPEEKTTPKKGSMSSNSFSYQKNVKHVRYETIEEDELVELRPKSKFRTPVKSELTVNPSKDNDMVTLVHTVSFYRRQQQTSSNSNTPVKKIQRPVTYHESTTTSTENDDSCDSSDEKSEYEDTAAVQEKVKKLFDEIGKQQTIMAQSSQALNLCAATIEFSGSTEAVEGERHLLVASHRRQAALDEIQRLRVEGSIRPIGSPQERGRLSINEITVPLKQDYIKKLASDAISGHHLVCLLKYNEHVLATKTIPTLPGLVAVKFPDVLQLTNVYADFKVTLEIYGMTAQKEILPHEIKYHIAMNKKHAKILTPKGKKGQDNRLVMPPVQSPAGPNTIRTPALSYYGFVIFSLREIQRTSWSLNQCSGVSPLEGTVHMKVNCELSVSVDHRGFLTMFEDVSGFGAWHRRWCRLNGHVLSYWKYPDDEKKKPPIGSIDLYNCCSQKISIAPRDVCARLNTMLLEIRRPCQEDDVESLVLVKQGKYTVLRHLLSADTKEEREEWCAYLNKSLALIRAWGPTHN